jgi:hypothetical protein
MGEPAQASKRSLLRFTSTAETLIMRDPARIQLVLDSIRTGWELQPDLRLGQIIVNAVRPPQPCPAIFYIEDDELVRRIENGFGVFVRHRPES